MHLRYDMYSAPAGHPQAVMRSLGITYQHATPQSIADQWWFWNCEGVPEDLPDFLTALNVEPHEAIGYGLDRATADAIAANKESAPVVGQFES